MPWYAVAAAGLSGLGSWGAHRNKKKQVRDHNRMIDTQQKSIDQSRNAANLDVQQREAQTNREMNEVAGVNPETMQAIASKWGHIISGRTQMEGQHLSAKTALDAERLSTPKFNWGGAIGDAALSAFQGHQTGVDIKRQSQMHDIITKFYGDKNRDNQEQAPYDRGNEQVSYRSRGLDYADYLADYFRKNFSKGGNQ